MDTVIVQMIQAGHDKNGNKRAAHLVFDMQGDLIEVHKYNFKYPHVINRNHKIIVNLPEMTVAPKELNEWIKSADLSSHVVLFD